MASANLKKFIHSSAINLLLQPLQMGSFIQNLKFIHSIQKSGVQSAWVLAYICCFLCFVAFSCLCFCIKFCKFAKATSKINAISNLMSHFLQTSIFNKKAKKSKFYLPCGAWAWLLFYNVLSFFLTQKSPTSRNLTQKTQ